MQAGLTLSRFAADKDALMFLNLEEAEAIRCKCLQRKLQD